jgi:hypothetical protein
MGQITLKMLTNNIICRLNLCNLAWIIRQNHSVIPRKASLLFPHYRIENAAGCWVLKSKAGGIPRPCYRSYSNSGCAVPNN